MRGFWLQKVDFVVNDEVVLVKVKSEKSFVIQIIKQICEMLFMGFYSIANPGDAAALAEGFLLGDDAGFSYELRKISRMAGITHLVAASGANLHFAASLWPKVSRLQGRFFVEFANIMLPLAYCYVAGWSSSLWRAAVMWCCVRVACIFGRPSPIWWGLCIALVGTYFINRTYLGEFGYHLSWLAVLGLFVSRIVLPGEIINGLFLQSERFLYYCISSILKGFVICVFVGWWLYLQFQVWQPLGVFSTLLLEPITGPMTYSALAWKATVFQNELHLLLHEVLVVGFWMFWQVSNVMAGIMTGEYSSVLNTFFVMGCCAVLGFLTVQRLQRMHRTQRWRSHL